MPTPVESAELLLKLYELRRDETMRKARDFILSFDPRSIGEIQTAMMGPDGAYIRMVTSFWDMAASFVLNGAIDPKMFDETNGEHIVAFGKFQPFLPEIRAMLGPNYMKHLEQLCAEAPGGLERVAATRERIRGMLAARAAAAAKA